jgi:hypothetical protein
MAITRYGLIQFALVIPYGNSALRRLKNGYIALRAIGGETPGVQEERTPRRTEPAGRIPAIIVVGLPKAGENLGILQGVSFGGCAQSVTAERLAR